MKRQMLSLAIAALFLLAALNAFSQEVPAPVFQDGDFWQFKAVETNVGGLSRSNPFDGVYELLYSQGNFKVFQLTDGKRGPADRSARGPLLALLGQNPVVKDLKFPFSVGQKWEYTFEFTMIGARKPFLQTVEISVTGVEQVATSAGTFSAFRLEKEETSRNGLHPWVGTFYYGPETKSVVKYFFDSTTNGAGTIREIELIKFRATR